MKPIVAIVGRPNVGKSCLFNRIVGRKKAIVLDEPGVTRDLNYGDVTDKDISFTLIDTGGFEPDAKDKMFSMVREQAQMAIEESDIIIFLMDARAGLTLNDIDVASILRKTSKPVIYTVNKVDTPAVGNKLGDFFKLGMEEIIPVSAEHGIGIDELIDKIRLLVPAGEYIDEDDERIRIAVVGRPNVGKSTLVNKLVGYERVMVSNIPGTTRDAIDTSFEMGKRKYILIDTAGIRQKGKISRTIERYAVVHAIRSIERCDVALILIDAVEGITEQDERIAGIAYEKGKGCILVINKWDAVEKETNTAKEYEERIKWKAKFLQFAPVVFVSALTGQRINKIIAVVDEVAAQLSTRVQTSLLNKFFNKFTKAPQPPRYKNKEIKVYYITQTSINPPTFVAFTNYPEGIHLSYERFLINRIREEFGLDKIPVKLIFKKR
ncbi:MAG: ribosome biogenesis GTPase Der [Deltaproteobacteria bacterium GWC2_42_11]|nr:MAG: ribosome biogenesis GTPase Der [Deltaproteobacteria bacterium GWC2_42_11]HBO83664.1 ribosome biogenesis GTPase Der [Deltaproteobacteria bacterium]